MGSSSQISTLSVILLLSFLLSSISEAIVPSSETFQYVNQGDFLQEDESFLIEAEYDPTTRPLPPFTLPFQLFFYNTTPNAFTLALRMGTRRSRTVRPWVWEANRGNPVRENATLTFARDGNLVLADADGRVAWQTNTANKGVVGFAILETGNIVLRDSSGNFVWQSFDYPTDTILLDQSLRIRGPNKLVSRLSITQNVDGPYSFVIEPKRLAMYYKIKNSPQPMIYWSSSFTEVNRANGDLTNCTLEIVGTDYEVVNLNFIRCRQSNSFSVSDLNLGYQRYNSTLSYLRLGIDGNLRLYTYRVDARADAWDLRFTLFQRGLPSMGVELESECQLPERCGKFGLCEDSQCVGCPSPAGVFAWSRDCDTKPVTSCRGSDFGYYELKGVDHYTVKYSRGTGGLTKVNCEARCTRDCKCTGYFYRTDTSRCWVVYDLKTLTRVGNSTHLAYIKTPKK